MNSELGFDLKDWEAAEAIEMGDFESVKLGGHEVVILGAKINEGEEGKKSLKVIVDIAGKDEQAGYFKKQFDESTKKDKKWREEFRKEFFFVLTEEITVLKGPRRCCCGIGNSFKIILKKVKFWISLFFDKLTIN